MLTVQVHSAVARGGSASISGDAWLWPVLVVSDATAVPAAMAGRPADEGSVVVGEPFQARASRRPNIGGRVRTRHRPLVTFEVDPIHGSLSPQQVRVGLAILLTVGDPRSPGTVAAVARFKQDLEQAVSVELAGQMGLPDLGALLAGKAVSADPQLAKQRFEALLSGDEVAVESGLAALEQGAVHELLATRGQGELGQYNTELAVLSRLATDPVAAASTLVELEVPRRDGGTGGGRTNPATSIGTIDGPLAVSDSATATFAQPFRLTLNPDLRLHLHAGFQPPAVTVIPGRPPLIDAIRPSVSTLALSSVKLAALDVAGLVAAPTDSGRIVASSFQSWTFAELEQRGTVVFRGVLKAPLTRRLSFQVRGAVAATVQVEDVVDSGAGVPGVAHLARLADGRVNLLASGSLITKPVDLSAVAGGVTAAGSPVAGTDGDGRTLVAWHGTRGEVAGVTDDGQGNWKDLGLKQALRGAKAAGALSLHTSGRRAALAWRRADGKVRLGLGDAQGHWVSAKGPDVVLSGDPVLTSRPRNKLFLLAGVDHDHHLRVWTQDRRRRWTEIDIPGGSDALGRPSWAVTPDGKDLWLCTRTQSGGVNLLRQKRDQWGRPLDLIELAGAPSPVSDPSLVLWQGHPVVAVLGEDLAVYILAHRPGLGWSRRALSASLGVVEAAREPSLEVSGKQLMATWTTASGRIISASRTSITDWTRNSGVTQ